MSIINKTPNIMQNAIRGAERQLGLSYEALVNNEWGLMLQHWEAAKLLEDFSKDYIPCLEGEL